MILYSLNDVKSMYFQVQCFSSWIGALEDYLNANFVPHYSLDGALIGYTHKQSNWEE